MATDPGRWGHSLGNLAELWLPLLEAVRPQTIIEIGAYAGDVTRILLDWLGDSGTRILSIDPDPQPALVELADEHPRLELVRSPSLEALPTLAPADVVIVDGDHNYYTVSQELRLIGERGRDDGTRLPLIICHDACWPHGRRDVYYSPELIPEGHRRPTVEGGFLFPDDRGLHGGGLPYRWPAVEEGGAANGVMTAIEDFVSERPELRLVVVPAFFGLALIWPRDATWSDEVAAILEPWGANPLLARLEANRVLHLASREVEATRAAWAAHQNNRKDAFLHKLLASRTFALAMWLSRLRRPGDPAFTREEIRELLS
jgi:hypothetical protein